MGNRVSSSCNDGSFVIYQSASQIFQWLVHSLDFLLYIHYYVVVFSLVSTSSLSELSCFTHLQSFTI